MKNSLRTLQTEYFKWAQSFKIHLLNELQYKLNFFLGMIIPVLVFFFIKYQLWTSIYAVNSKEILQGYTLSKMIEYQFWILILEIFSRSHYFSENISSSIRLGKISSFLIYPFSFISYHFSLFFSQKFIQMFIGVSAILLAVLFDWVKIPLFTIFLQAGIFIIVINIFWFLIQLFVGFLSFWLEETWSLNAAIRFVIFFLSGAIMPLELYPDFLVKILLWTPFPYLIYTPVKILMGEEVAIGFSLFILCAWLCTFYLLVYWIWKRGLRQYTGVGI